MPDYDKQRPKVEPPTLSLATLRGSHGLTQDVVAERVAAIINSDFTKGGLSAIELGHRGASAEVLAALEVVFRLTAGSLKVPYKPSHNRRKAARSEQVSA